MKKRKWEKIDVLMVIWIAGFFYFSVLVVLAGEYLLLLLNIPAIVFATIIIRVGNDENKNS